MYKLMVTYAYAVTDSDETAYPGQGAVEVITPIFPPTTNTRVELIRIAQQHCLEQTGGKPSGLVLTGWFEMALDETPVNEYLATQESTRKATSAVSAAEEADETRAAEAREQDSRNTAAATKALAAKKAAPVKATATTAKKASAKTVRRLQPKQMPY